MSEDQEAYDAGTGELFERPEFASAEAHAPSRQTLSERAQSAIKAPGYWDKREGVMRSSAKRSFALALLRVHGDLKPVIEAEASNPFTKKNYASLGMVLTKISPVLKKHRFILKQGAGKLFSHGKGEQYFLPVFLELIHAPTAESERQMVEIPLTKVDPQGIGIALSYGRRYLLLSYFGFASMDDDAAGAVKKRLDLDEEAEATAFIIENISNSKTVKDLRKIADENSGQMSNFSEGNAEKLRAAYGKRRDFLKEQAKKAAEEVTEGDADRAQLGIERDTIAVLDGRKGKKQ